jgi:hypothetical protein
MRIEPLFARDTTNSCKHRPNMWKVTAINFLHQRSIKFSTEMQYPLSMRISPENTEISRKTDWCSITSAGSCNLMSGDPCRDGCWFIFSESGCKQGSDCGHCHQELCCLLADLKRREIRKQHSRMRPSKKKREHDKRQKYPECYGDDCESVSTAGCESSHSAGSLVASPKGSNYPPPHSDLIVIETLLQLIRSAVETDGSRITL